MKYIFVTGGVVSSLGKGLAAASLGTLLELRGLRVVFQKFDPYLNVDPGTMNPFQHGEVYVLNDGAETDLDLGHYERFTNCVLSRHNNLTSGQVYESVINKERRGDYLGKTVQVIPHVTDEIKNRIREISDESKYDVVITEVGGTTGDIEGLPFLEAIRQFILEVGPQNVVNIHVTLVPYIKAARELKTKPTQQSIAKLREIGLQPQVLMCRTEHALDAELRQKLSMFCNVAPEAVIEVRDVAHTIYEAPLMFHAEGLDALVCKLLSLQTPEPDLSNWRKFVERVVTPKKRVKIAVVGKYIDLQDAYKSIYESLTHAAASQDCGIDLKLVDAVLQRFSVNEFEIDSAILARRRVRKRFVNTFVCILKIDVFADDGNFYSLFRTHDAPDKLSPVCEIRLRSVEMQKAAHEAVQSLVVQH